MNVMIYRRAICIVAGAGWRVREGRIARRAVVYVCRDKRCVMAFVRRWIRIRTIVGLVIGYVVTTMRVLEAIVRVAVIHRPDIVMAHVWT